MFILPFTSAAKIQPIYETFDLFAVWDINFQAQTHCMLGDNIS